jgi:hypothetical protein
MDKEKLQRSLEKLTPQGSEFHNDPERCIEYIKDRLDTTIDFAKQNKRLEAENERLLKAITDGRLRSGHFKAWKEQIRIQQGYDGSELTCLLDRLAEVVFEDKPKEYYQRQLIGDNKPIVNHYDDGDNGCDGQVSGAGSTALTNYKNISEALKEIKRIIKKEK